MVDSLVRSLSLTAQKVWVVYCTEEQHYRFELPFEQGMTAQQLLHASGLMSHVALPEPLILGVFGLKISEPSVYIMQAGDRLEVYRPLKMNPKEVRRKRAQRHPVGRFQKGNHHLRQRHITTE